MHQRKRSPGCRSTSQRACSVFALPLANTPWTFRLFTLQSPFRMGKTDFQLGRSEDPSFVIKTMVVQAASPGATIEEALKQVTERLERKLQETP